MREFKTQVTVVAHLGDKAMPRLRDDLKLTAGRVDDLLVATHGTTRRQFVLYRFEYELLRDLCDGIPTLDMMLARAARHETPLGHDQLADFLVEMSALGVVEGTLGIEPKVPVHSLPWPEPALAPIPSSSLTGEDRGSLSAATAAFRSGDLRSALANLGRVNVPGTETLKVAWVRLAEELQPAAPPPSAELPAVEPEAEEMDDWAAGFEEEEGTELLESLPPLTPVVGEKGRSRIRRTVIVALVAAAVLMVVPVPFKLRHPCTVKPARTAWVRAGLASAVQAVHVRSSQLVKAGDLLVELDEAEQRNRVDALQAELEQARATLALLEEGERTEAIAGYLARVGGLARAYSAAKRRADTLAGEVRRGEAPRSELGAARAEQSTLAGELNAAQAELDLARAGARTEDIEKAATDVEAIAQQLAFEEIVLSGASLRASIDGQVLSARPAELIGRVFAPGEAVLEIAALHKLRVEVAVPEREYDSLEFGAKLGARVQGYPEIKLESRVSRLGHRVVDGIVTVVGEIENPGVLQPGMTGWAEIDAGWKPLGALLGRRALRWFLVQVAL